MTTAPLAYSIERDNQGLDLPRHERERLLDTLSWRATPRFPRRGRMAWHVLDQPVRGNFPGGRAYRAVKIKGVGAYNPPEPGAEHRDRLFDRFSPEPVQPTTVPLESFVTYPHLGVRESGEFFVAYGSLAPVGGIVLDRAVCEHEKAERLCERGVPAVAPLLVARYDDLTFQGQPMGVVLTLVPDPAPFRLSELQFGAALNPGHDEARDAYVARVTAALGVEGDTRDEATRLRAVCAVSRKMGEAIRRFSLAGLYRYSADLNNFDFDPGTADVILTDLDSTQWMADLSPRGQRLQALRDLAMLPYRIAGKFYTPTALGRYTIDNLLAYDAIAAALKGYFPDGDRGEIERISAALWDFFVPHFDLLHRWKDQLQGGWPSERRRSYKMDHQIFSLAAFYLLHDLFARSKVGAAYPDEGVTKEGILRAVHDFLGDRAQYFDHVLRRAGM